MTLLLQRVALQNSNNGRLMKIAASSALITLALYTASCSTVSKNMGEYADKAVEKMNAYTKSSKAMSLGSSNLSDEQEYYIGRSVAARIASGYKIYTNKSRTRYINRLGVALSRYSSRPEIYAGYHFMLLESKELNAFGAPGGFIFITTGLYKSAKNEEQLAAILAHEISHVTLKHGISSIEADRINKGIKKFNKKVAKGVSTVAQKLSSADIDKMTAAFEGSVDDIVSTISSGYSHKFEFEADAEAFSILRRAGYAPKGLVSCLKTLQARARGGDKAGFNKTHPPAEERIKRIGWLVKRLKTDLGKPAPIRTKRYKRYAFKK